MNETLKLLLSMIVLYLRSSLKSPKALKALQAIAPYLIEARDLLDQVINSIPVSAVSAHRKAIKAGKSPTLGFIARFAKIDF